MIKNLNLIILLILLFSCGKEEFASIKQYSTSDAPITLTTSAEICANHTLVKPYVDFLFLWDNTSSQTFVNEATRQSLANTVSLISKRFDYRILLAPMLANNNDHAFIISATENGLSQSAKNIKVNIEDAYSRLLSFPTTTKSQENGIERAVELLEYNYQTNSGVFRKEAYLVIVLMSNGNDQINSSSGFYNGTATTNYINDQFNKLKNISANDKLNTLYTRFISLVAHSECNSGWRIGESYKKFSKLVHNEYFNCSEDSSSDIQCSSSSPDSHNICEISFSNLFDAVNDSIIETVIKHKYNFWPISFQKDPINFDIKTLKVTKNTGQELFEVPDQSIGSGWKYIGWKDNQPTTYEPFIGESKNAYFIELVGDARVSYPECLVLTYDSPTYFYGYLSIPHQPYVPSMIVKDGDNIVPSDKWEYIGYVEEQNLRIQGPNNPSSPFQEFYPADLVKGKFIIKLDESLIYQNDQGSRFTVIYDTATN